VDFIAPGFITRKDTVQSTTGNFTVLLIPVDEEFLLETWFNKVQGMMSFTATMESTSCVVLSPELSGDSQVVAAHQEAVDRMNAIIKNDRKRIGLGGSCSGLSIVASIDTSMRSGDWFATISYIGGGSGTLGAISRASVSYGSVEPAQQVNLVMNGIARAVGLRQPARPSMLASFYARQFSDFTVEDKAVIRGLLDRGPGRYPPDNSSSRR
jgi:hypothetical protein